MPWPRTSAANQPFPLDGGRIPELGDLSPSAGWMGVIYRLRPDPMKKHPSAVSTIRARKLRQNPTSAEARMWLLLREQLPDGRWRRQVPLRNFIADFASHRFKVVVELDGGQHTESGDAARSAVIESEGYRIIRFWNNELLGSAEGCLTRLQELIRQTHPHPTATRRSAKSSYPSPIKGEECS